MTDDRAVSVAVTHVMTVGITTLLITGLLMGAGNMLDTQTDRAGERELRAIGDRVGGEIATAAVAGEANDANVTVRSRQPGRAVGGSYSVNLSDTADCYARSGYDGCLVLQSSATNLEVEIPVGVPEGVAVESNTVQGGDVVVHYFETNRTVTIRGEDA